MKNISYLINGILAVAIIVLFILFFTNKGGNGSNSPSVTISGGDSVPLLPVAYVNVDSLLINYNFAKDENDKLMRKIESSNATVNQRRSNLEKEVTEFYRKYQTGAFLNEQRAQQEQERIQKLEANLQQFMQRTQNDIALEQQRVNEQVADSVRLGVELFNNTANYQIIFSNSGLNNVLLAKQSYDITQDILKLLNGRYVPESK
jgi:outer membrane protein